MTRLLKKGPRQSRPEPKRLTPGEELLLRATNAAAGEGKTLGEWLYEALSEPFDFKGPWSAPAKALTRKKYNKAAATFARRLTDAAGEQ